MGNLVVWALDDLVLVELFDALEAEGVTAGQRDGLLVVVIVRFKADAALEYLILYLLLHFFIRILLIVKKMRFLWVVEPSLIFI